MILVTGAGGNVGGELVKLLAASKIPVRAGYHSPESMAKAKAKGINAVAIDFRKPETLREAMQGVDTLFLVSGNDPEQTQLELNAVREAKEAGVQRVVKLSVWGAETEEFSYAKIHRPVERAIEGSGMRWTFLRPNGFHQNMGNFYARAIKGQGTFHLPAGNAKVSHVDVRDIASSAAALMMDSSTKHDSRIYGLSGPEALSYSEIAAELSRQLGRPIRFVDLPDEAFVKGAVAAGVEPSQANNLVELMHFYKEGRASDVTSEVERITGKKPRSFRQYLADHIALFR